MKLWRDFGWWLCFIILSVCVQALAPGLDILAVGLIILLQEDDYKGMLWLLPLFILLQEGMGTRHFGASLIWYAAIIALFKLGRWIFDSRKFLFIFLLSACMGAAYFALAWLLAPLQNLVFNMDDTLEKSIAQAIFIPFAWRMIIAIRKPKYDDEEENGN